MRPIKYRAFHKELKVMREVLEINIAHDEVTVYLENDDIEVCECETWFEGTFKLMQFTGLHDRNGNEIYEGDILQIEHFLFYVTFDQGCFVVKETKESEMIFALSNINQFSVVVSNIHSNP